MTPLERADVERFRELIARRFGLQYDDGRLDYLADVLRQRLEATASPCFEVYAEKLASSFHPGELRALAEELTVNETFFFRNTDNFRALAEHVLPELFRKRASERRLRILSAGCASGEEPYSIAISVREALSDLDRWEVKIIGVDLSPSMLAKASLAHYSAWSLRATSARVQSRYFCSEGKVSVLDSTVRAMVTFEERNLTEDNPFLWQSAGYDLVFCRNVMMYFTPEVQRRVVGRIAKSLLPGGFLFLGHAETLRGLSQEFHLCHTHDTFYYQKRDGTQSPARDASLLAWSNDSVSAVLPAVVDGSASWVDAIQHASERIAELARPSAPRRNDSFSAKGVAHPPTIRSWDLGLVLEAMRQERFSDALSLLSALPPESHSEPDALLLRAVLLTNSGKLQEAQDFCARLLALDELNAGAQYLMALCREHAADPAGAIEHDRTAIYLDAGFAMPHLHLGLMARRAGDPTTARLELSRARTLLAQEDASRLLLFGGGFSRDTLLALCHAELSAVGGDP